MVNALGVRGEDIAVAHLLALNWQVIDRNWRCGFGEIDIIAVDDEGTTVFCEVKCRAGRGFGDPLEAITYAKLTRLRRLAAHWLRQEPTHGGRVRIDAIGVLKRRGWEPQINHIRGIA